LGANFNDGTKYNYVWGKQFLEQIQAGILYPRWLPSSFAGLGSPAFYFYPPLAFFIDSLVGFVTLDVLPVHYRLSVAAAALLWLSGESMYVWLGSQVSRAAALIGAIGYMAAPYHLLDHYLRGALAEFASYAVLPLVMINLQLIARRRPLGSVGLALCYAALIMTHLPVALLASTTIIPLFLCFLASRAGSVSELRDLLRRATVGLLLGGGLAAGYLAPAMLLQRAVSTDELWENFFRVENWFVLEPSRWPRPALMVIITFLMLGALVLATAVVIMVLRGRWPADRRTRDAAFWAVTCIICCLLMAGVLPAFWTMVPFVAKVQFPWRLMVLADFAAVTAIVLVRGSASFPRLVTVIVVAGLIAGPGVLLIGKAAARSLQETWQGWATFQRPADILMRDADEYLPSGVVLPTGAERTDKSFGPLLYLSPITCLPSAPACQVTPADSSGALRVHVEAVAATHVVLRRFYFPTWQVDSIGRPGPVAAAPSGDWRLLSFSAPAGTSDFLVHSVPTAAERWGQAGSAMSAFLVACQALAEACARLRRRRLVPRVLDFE
jgi:hypothetical protein